ncbi:MAG: hypothetical protein ACYDAY_02320 [Candidatus Dormibacteria bacterium]
MTYALALAPVLAPLAGALAVDRLARFRVAWVPVAALAAALAAAAAILGARPAGSVPLSAPIARLGSVVAVDYRVDALAIAVVAAAALALALAFLLLQGELDPRLAAAALAGLAGLDHLAESRSLLAAYPGWELCLAVAWLAGPGPSRQRLPWVALASAVPLLGAGFHLAGGGAGTDYALVPVDSVTVPVAAALAAAAVLRLALAPLVLRSPAERLLGGILAAASALYLGLRIFELGDGRLPAFWMGGALSAAGSALALAAGWRAATRTRVAPELPLLFGGLALAAAGTSSPLGVVAALALLAAGLLSAPVGWSAGSASGFARVIGAWTQVGLPGSLLFLGVQFLGQGAGQAGPGPGALALAGIVALVGAGYGTVRELGRAGGSGRAWPAVLVGLGLALLAAFPDQLAARALVPAAASVVRFPTAVLGLTPGAESSPAGAWPAGPAAVALALAAASVALVAWLRRPGAETGAGTNAALDVFPAPPLPTEAAIVSSLLATRAEQALGFAGTAFRPPLLGLARRLDLLALVLVAGLALAGSR